MASPASLERSGWNCAPATRPDATSDAKRTPSTSRGRDRRRAGVRHGVRVREVGDRGQAGRERVRAHGLDVVPAHVRQAGDAVEVLDPAGDEAEASRVLLDGALEEQLEPDADAEQVGAVRERGAQRPEQAACREPAIAVPAAPWPGTMRRRAAASSAGSAVRRTSAPARSSAARSERTLPAP